MVKKSAIFLLSASLALIQFSTLDELKIWEVRPDLILVALFLGSLFVQRKEAFILAISLGLLKDIFSCSFLGINTLLFAFYIFIGNQINLNFSFEDNFSRTAFFLILSLLHNLSNGFYRIFLGGQLTLGVFLRLSLIASFYNSGLLYLLLKLKEKYESQNSVTFNK